MQFIYIANYKLGFFLFLTHYKTQDNVWPEIIRLLNAVLGRFTVLLTLDVMAIGESMDEVPKSPRLETGKGFPLRS